MISCTCTTWYGAYLVPLDHMCWPALMMLVPVHSGWKALQFSCLICFGKPLHYGNDHVLVGDGAYLVGLMMLVKVGKHSSSGKPLIMVVDSCTCW